MQFGCILVAFDFVFLFFVFQTFDFLSELCDLMGQEGLFLCHNLQQVAILLVLLGKDDKIFGFKGFFVFLRNCLVGQFHRQIQRVNYNQTMLLYIARIFVQNYKISMQYLKPDLQGDDASVILSILDASREISYFLRHSPIIQLESVNKFGDQQLHQDVECDLIIEKHLKKNPKIKFFASQERPHLHPTREGDEGDGYIVTFDPLDGSSIVDTNFSIGSIFSIWKVTDKKLIGETLRAQVNAVLVVYGPRTTAITYNEHQKKVQEFTMVEEDWIVSHDHLVIQDKAKIFSPGNLRCASDNEEYRKVIDGWMKRGFTLRYTGGLIVDVAQIFIKRQGIFCCVGSQNHKAKLRALYEVGAMGFLIEKAGGHSIINGKRSVLDYEIKDYDCRLAFAVGSKEEIDYVSHLF